MPCYRPIFLLQLLRPCCQALQTSAHPADLLTRPAGHNAKTCPSLGVPTCYDCGQPGHISKEVGWILSPLSARSCADDCSDRYSLRAVPQPQA